MEHRSFLVPTIVHVLLLQAGVLEYWMAMHGNSLAMQANCRALLLIWHQVSLV